MFTPHPNLSDKVNGGIIQSEIEGGVFLHDLPPSTVLEIQTIAIEPCCWAAAMR
jgi:hypothetical protein